MKGKGGCSCERPLSFLPMRRFFIAFLALFMAPVPAQAAKGDYVVLLHGIARSPASMSRMAKDFEKRGYQVLNLGYESTTYKIEDLADKIHPAVESFATDPARAIHFVGHSMGGLVIRAYIAKHRPKNMGRVVMFGTPNQGSEVADFLMKNWAYKKFYGPNGQQLGTDQDFDKKFGKIDFEAGIIAGDRTIDPFSSFILPGDDDGKVTVKRTHVAGEKDHIVLHVNHAFIASSHAVIVEAAHFLQYGFFKRASQTD